VNIEWRTTTYWTAEQQTNGHKNGILLLKAKIILDRRMDGYWTADRQNIGPENSRILDKKDCRMVDMSRILRTRMAKF
jgi:hypothetical protein